VNNTFMQVQVLFPAPDNDNPNQIFLIGDGFGLLVCFAKYEEIYFRNGVDRKLKAKLR
jgi:hypothetical protein